MLLWLGMDTEQNVTAEETTEQEKGLDLPETAVSETVEQPKKPKKKSLSVFSQVMLLFTARMGQWSVYTAVQNAALL